MGLVCSAALTADPEPPDAAAGQVVVLLDEGQTLSAKGDWRGAESRFQQALAIARSTTPFPPLTESEILGELGLLYESFGKLRSAETNYTEEVELLRRSEATPEVLGVALHRLGRVFLQRRDFPRAEPIFQELLVLWDSVENADEAKAGVLHNLGEICRLTDRPEQAEGYHSQALELRKHMYGERSPEAAESMRALGVALTVAHRYDDAEPLLWEALAIYQEAVGPDHLAVADGLRDLASLYRAAGTPDRSEPLMARVRAIEEANAPAEEAQGR